MSLTNAKMKEDLSEWAEQNKDKTVFPEISEEETSYYIDRNSEETYMMEYSLDDLQSLRNNLEKYPELSSDLNLLKNLTIGISRNRVQREPEKHGDPNSDHLEENTVTHDERTLPEYVYVF